MIQKLFVAGLDYTLTEEELRAHFSTVGKVKYVKIIMNHETGNNKGFGFVEMEDEAQSQEAIDKLNNSMLKNRAIAVKEAKPQEKKFNNR